MWALNFGSDLYPIGSMYGIYMLTLGVSYGILMVNVTIDSIHGSYGYEMGIAMRIHGIINVACHVVISFVQRIKPSISLKYWTASSGVASLPGSPWDDDLRWPTRGWTHQPDFWLILVDTPVGKWVCLKMGYIPNEIAIFHRDNDQQNHWVQWGTLFSDTPKSSTFSMFRAPGGFRFEFACTDSDGAVHKAPKNYLVLGFAWYPYTITDTITIHAKNWWTMYLW